MYAVVIRWRKLDRRERSSITAALSDAAWLNGCVQCDRSHSIYSMYPLALPYAPLYSRFRLLFVRVQVDVMVSLIEFQSQKGGVCCHRGRDTKILQCKHFAGWKICLQYSVSLSQRSGKDDYAETRLTQTGAQPSGSVPALCITEYG